MLGAFPVFTPAPFNRRWRTNGKPKSRRELEKAFSEREASFFSNVGLVGGDDAEARAFVDGSEEAREGGAARRFGVGGENFERRLAFRFRLGRVDGSRSRAERVEAQNRRFGVGRFGRKDGEARANGRFDGWRRVVS